MKKLKSLQTTPLLLNVVFGAMFFGGSVFAEEAETGGGVESVESEEIEEVKEEEIPQEIYLVFSDRVLTLNFQAQPELLQKTPSHFVRFGEERIPVDFKSLLPGDNEFLKIETDFTLEISPKKLEEFFLQASILRDKKTSSVEILLDDDENIVFEGTPQDGFEIEFEKLKKLLNEAISSGQKNVRVPAKKVFSEVVVHPDLKEKGIEEVVAVGESNFSGSSKARRQNIKAAARKFNGQIIGKDRRFSFNEILESVSEKDGFVRELVIKGNETRRELGGGVCQVSTTAFRAAFSGGLPIVSRRNHSYAVPYYKPFGLDATIYLGAQDFRFYNDTPGDILIQAFVEGDNLFFVFYGTNDQRNTSLRGPFISEYKKAPMAIVYETEDLPPGKTTLISGEHDGFRAEWVRRVEYADKVVTTDNLISNYRAWPAKVLRGKEVVKKRGRYN